MSKPSILLIPGSFVLPEFYDPIVDAVAAEGYQIRALHLPAVGLAPGLGREGAPPAMYDDAAFIAKEVEKLADEGKDVVLIAHSYGGTPATQSIKGLGREERQRQGKKGGIVALAYMTAIVPAVGSSASSTLADRPKESQIDMTLDENGWLSHENVPQSAAISFSDLPKEEGEGWVKKFARHSAASFAGEVTYAGYRDVPVSWLFCEHDLCVPPKKQREEIEMIEKESAKNVNVTSIKAGHCPSVSQPQAVIDWFLDVAAKAA